MSCEMQIPCVSNIATRELVSNSFAFILLQKTSKIIKNIFNFYNLLNYPCFVIINRSDEILEFRVKIKSMCSDVEVKL